MRLNQLWIRDFRNYDTAELAPAPDGLTVVLGGNGQGKTNLLEAIGYLATTRSFRGAAGEALVKRGCSRAVVRAEVVRDKREVLIEAELALNGRDRILLNRQALRRASDLCGIFQVSVFSPDDLILVKGGPGERRRYLDDTLVGLRPSTERLLNDLERVLRQRNVLLKQAGGRSTPGVLTTLDVWDIQLARMGGELVERRRALVERLGPLVAGDYSSLTGHAAGLALAYRGSWTGDLAEALAEKRPEDLRRGITTVGPHRDDLEIGIVSRDAGAVSHLPARTHASQGEQRSVALALRLGAHQLVTDEIGEGPVLLLDDVFSELDAARCGELIRLLPGGQAVLTTAGEPPAGVEPAAVVRVEAAQVGAGLLTSVRSVARPGPGLRAG